MTDQTYTAEQAMKSLQYLAEFASMCVGEDADKHEKLVAAFIGHLVGGWVIDGLPSIPTKAMYNQMYEVKQYVEYDRFCRDWARMLTAVKKVAP